jgi:hypothetical protein
MLFQNMTNETKGTNYVIVIALGNLKYHLKPQFTKNEFLPSTSTSSEKHRAAKSLISTHSARQWSNLLSVRQIFLENLVFYVFNIR